MTGFEVMALLVAVFGDRLRTTRQYYQFHIRAGATIYVRRGRSAGFENVARIREIAIHRFPGGEELDAFLTGEPVRRQWRTRWYDFCIGPEHIDAVVEILLGGLDLSEDFIESDDWAA